MPSIDKRHSNKYISQHTHFKVDNTNQGF